MKKILAIALAAILLLPLIPAYAADRTTVFVDDYNDISEKLTVTIKCGEGFEGATINVGGNIIHTVEESGAGTYTSMIDLSSLNKSGPVEVRIVANYPDDADTVTKNITVSKMETTVTDYSYDTINNQREVNVGTNTFGKVNESGTELKLSFTGHSLGANNKRLDIRIGAASTQDTNANPAGAIYTFEGEMLFKNNETSDEKEQPNMYLTFRVRQDKQYSIESGYPIDRLTGASVSSDDYGMLFGENGKLLDGSPYYTNVWYKFRFVFDIYAKTGDDLTGGVRTYIAEDSGEGYSDFKLLKEIKNLVFKNIQQWRWDPTATDAGSVVMKNFKLIKEEPIDTWYLNDCEYSEGKLNLDFSEDLGTLSAENVKIYNKNGDDVKMASVTKTGDGTYEILPEKTLQHGREYDVLIKNSTVSSSGLGAFKEPDADENDDGMWKLATFAVPEYPLNIASVTNNGSSVEVSFNNEGAAEKYAAVCWYDSFGAMVDFKTQAIVENTLTFSRKNASGATLTEVYVFGVNTDDTSEEYGAIEVYDSYICD